MHKFSWRLFKPNFTTHQKVCTVLYSSKVDKLPEKTTWKSFEEIPGPPRLPFFGNLHLFSRFGPYSFDKLYEAYDEFYKTYGPVVRLDLGISMLALFNPEDIQKVLDLSDQYPHRPIMKGLRHYRLHNKDKYRSLGLVTDNGEEWKRLRDAINFIMSPKFVETYLPDQEAIAEDFIRRISMIKDSEGRIKDFLRELYRYTSEAIGFVCFGLRLGLMDESKSDTTWSAEIIQASHDALKSLADTTLEFPWWKIIKTQPYKKLEETQEFFYKFTTECMEKVKSKMEDSSNLDDITVQFYKTLSKNSSLEQKDVNLLMMEIFQSGIDATGNQIGYILYHLTQNPDVQDNLHKEIDTYAPLGQSLTKIAINKMAYLRACIKESYRLTPTAGGTARILKSPVQISGYLVPANVLCIGINPVICLQPQHFPDPQQFKPERWLKENASVKTAHPFCVLPFSHGTRRCVGQRFAEQEIKICIIKILQNYRIKYEGPPVGSKMRLLLIPDKPLNFVFEKRYST